MKSSPLDKILDAEARSMGREISLVNAHSVEVDGVEVWTVIYRVAPVEVPGMEPRMHETRFTVWADGRQKVSGIIDTRWGES